MLGETTHKTNKKLALLLYVAFFAVLYFATSCTATKLNKSTRKSDVTSATNSQENQNKKSTLFDRSTITQEDYSLKYIPIDPTQYMGVTTNPNTGEQQYRNAIPVYETSTKKTNKDVTTEENEAKTTATEGISKATTNETNKEKIKFSIPWYAFLILGFFGFATIIGLTLIHKVSKNIAAFSGTIAAFESRLKKLEQ